MRAPTFVLLFALPAIAIAEPCFELRAQAPGWMRVELPPTAPALAASAEIDQFRPGESTVLIEDNPALYAGTRDGLPGRTIHELSLQPGTRRVQLTFASDLRGAKVDAIAYAGGRAFPLLDERRIRGTTLELEWPVTDVTRLEIEVHDHARSKVGLRHWTIERIETMEPEKAGGMRAPQSLWVLHPGGSLRVCHAPGRTLRVHAARLGGAARTGVLEPAR